MISRVKKCFIPRAPDSDDHWQSLRGVDGYLPFSGGRQRGTRGCSGLASAERQQELSGKVRTKDKKYHRVSRELSSCAAKLGATVVRGEGHIRASGHRKKKSPDSTAQIRTLEAFNAVARARLDPNLSMMGRRLAAVLESARAEGKERRGRLEGEAGWAKGK
jgi:hypothetical protein